jgi:hypothetical protein
MGPGEDIELVLLLVFFAKSNEYRAKERTHFSAEMILGGFT